MKVVYFAISLVVTLAVIIALNSTFGKIPAFGPFLSPQHGFWQNAEPVESATDDVTDAAISADAEVFFDNRMVPHIFATTENDAYFVQGYLHAKFRLWQMEFQIMAASGRLSEILGAGPDSAYLNNDRKMRRMGMVYGAKKSLQKMETDKATREQLDAYTAGVNHYIGKLTTSSLPLEYRLLNYVPEKWSKLKTALLLKYLSMDLTGDDSDIEYTNARTFFSEDDYNKLYPLINTDADPIIPKGTTYREPAVKVKVPDNADSVYFNWKKTVEVETADIEKDNGSNNWAVAGSKTQSGRPMLCNDPHLGLNLPSLWYEVQISTPQYNVYGVSLPGAPAVIIGFNDSIAWGITNGSRDVLDYYKIEFRNEDHDEYLFNNQWAKAEKQVESYVIKGGGVFYDTVAYTVFGPVVYDEKYNGSGRVGSSMNLAMRWKAHDPSNEFKTINLLNKARNLGEYEKAISYFQCPGQNFVFASKSGDIAIWHQGQFPAKWYRQGDFIMPGTDSTYMWKRDIPQRENPNQRNPARGFVSSANQIPADTSYPYYLNTDYDVYRGFAINRFLANMNNATVTDMQNLQNENLNTFAETTLPILFQQTDSSALNEKEKKYFDIVRRWNFRNDSEEDGATIFAVWIDSLQQLVYGDEFAGIPGPTAKPHVAALVDLLKKDSALAFIDDVKTPQVETAKEVITAAFRAACKSLIKIENEGRLSWSRYKDTGIRHLLRMEQLSRFHLKTGGGVHVINATKQYHGPSWKMIVHLTDEVEAYGIYPGGQSGNPGCKSYDEFVDDWASGKYYRLWMMKRTESSDRRVKGKIRFKAQ